MVIFRQILDLDDEDNHDFSLSMVEEYFEQAEETFKKLDKNFKDENLSELSTLGHFLKGSSAAIGLVKVQASCEKIQHYGSKRDEEAKKDLKREDALDKIKSQLGQLRVEYAEAKQSLEDFFYENKD
ncbi:histidine-phosphotransfer domain, HPT domain-containing protein [Phlegmacium glaucopus]|nr:histidine-phosphotransfer domain, HPT domain-containing protein [Phlegmacium glaucopus]